MLKRITWLALGALLLLTTGPMLAAQLLADSANLDLLKASAKCRLDSRSTGNLSAWVYPPIECPENSFLLARADEFYQIALTIAPDPGGYRERAIEVEFARNQLDEAAENLAQFLSSRDPQSRTLKPGNFVFHILNSRIQESGGKITQAIAESETGLRLSGTRWTDDSKRAETIHLAGLYAKAARIASSTGVTSDLYRAGLYSACAADWPAAAISIGKVVRANDLQSRLTITQIAVSKMILNFAQWQAAGSFQLQPTQPVLNGVAFGTDDRGDPYIWLGDRLIEIDSGLCWPGELAVFQALATMANDNGEGAFRAAQILFERSGWESAREYYYLAAAQEPDNAEFAFELGMNVLTYEGDEAEALHWLQKAFDLKPKAIYAVRLAQTYQALGQTGQALFYADRSMELPPEDDWVRFWAGRIYRENGRTDAARRAFEEAFSMNPNNEEARNELLILEGK